MLPGEAMSSVASAMRSSLSDTTAPLMPQASLRTIALSSSAVYPPMDSLEDLEDDDAAVVALEAAASVLLEEATALLAED
ncbi:hypothetical protein GCM10009861_15680 [Neomicrococcus aestuarii]